MAIKKKKPREIKVACPVCEAKPGHDCHPQDDASFTMVHAGRIRVYRENLMPLRGKLTRQETMVETTDTWYPNLNVHGDPDRTGKHVRLSLLGLSSGQWRVCLWGGDDFGMERDFDPTAKSDAQELFDLVRGGGPVSQKDLKALGFGPA